MKKLTTYFKSVITLCSLLVFLLASVSCEGFELKFGPDEPEEEQQDDDDGNDEGLMVFDADTSACNTNYVNLEKYGVHICSADTVGNTYILEVGANIPDIQPGSVLTLDADSTGYIVRVSKVEQQGDRICLTAEPASLSDVFGNTSFILSTATEQASTRTRVGDIPVIYPVAMCYHDEDETLVREDFTADTRAVSGLHNLWEKGINYDGAELYRAGNFSLTMDKSTIKGSLDLEFYLSFGGFKKLVENVQDFYTQYRSSSVSMNAKLIGTLDMNQVMRAHVDGSFDTRNGHSLSDYNELVKHKVFPDVDFKFLVGNVPVWIKVGTDLFREVNLQGEGSLDFTAGFHNTTSLSSGFNWSQQGGITPVASADNTFTRVGPTLKGQGKLTGKLWPFYPRISVRFYTVLGPTFDLKPYIQSTLEGGFQLDAKESYAAWSLTNEAGVDFKAGLSTFFMNYESARFCETGDLNLGSKELYRSPVGLERTDKSECTAGTRNTLKFNVRDQDGISGRDILTILPQVVSFEGDGTLSQHYALAKDGGVSIDWTPKKSTDKLRAILYAPSGTVIDEIEVEASACKSCPDGNHPHAIDLGLPSGTKWCCCNVGASTPEGYGGYYAWGETSEKSEYWWDNYAFDDPETGNFQNIGSDIAGTSYDVARVKMGGSWCMPSLEQIQELTSNCTQEWTTQSGVNGILVTGPNGGQIFLPAAGRRWDDSLSSEGSDGDYWSSTLYSGNGGACGLLFDSGYWGWYDFYRYDGRSVRAVCP